MKKFLLLVFLSLILKIASAQLTAIPDNLSNIRSADITNDQVGQLVGQMRQNNFTADQVYQMLIGRGMYEAEAARLKSRIETFSTQTVVPPAVQQSSKTGRYSSSNTEAPSKEKPSIITPNPLKIFGLDIFNNGVLSFEPNLKIATPTNYVIGPDDEISISIYGYQEARYNLTVSPEGDINIPLIGVIYVSGLTIEQATEKIKSKLAANGYANIRTGLTKVNISIGRIRSIRITVLGEVNKPGTYTLTSLSTAFNALYLSGGPNDIGSMRAIEILRNGKIIDKLDIYDFLVKGDQEGNIRLQDQDIIRVPPYKTRISFEGEVKRTGLFEVLPGENLEKVLDFAGGFTDSAYTASIKSYKVTDTEKKIFDITKENFKTYLPSRSEAFVVRKIMDRITNRVIIRGAVFMPGEYEFTEGLTLLDLIKKAQGLREDAYRSRGLILRYNDDKSTKMLQFTPGGLINGSENNVELKRNDEVSIASIFDLKENFNITVSGEVRHPGAFTYTPDITLKDLILLSGGFTDAAAPQRIEVSRRIKSDSVNRTARYEIAKVIEVGSAIDLNIADGDIKLEPWDVVQVRRNPGYRTQVNVNIEGEVFFPGPYVITSSDERVSDLVKRAGGLTPEAYKKGAYITRINRSAILKDVGISQVEKIQKEVNDSSDVLMKDITAATVKIGVNLVDILQRPYTNQDLTLQEGDVLTVTKELFAVKVNGEVMFPTQIVFKEGEDLRYYINKAGGFTDDARKKKTYVLYGNGNAAKTKRFLFVKSYPKIEPGSEILVPKATEHKRDKLTSGEIVAISSGVASVVGMVIALLNFLK